jgi:hypothetical protein
MNVTPTMPAIQDDLLSTTPLKNGDENKNNKTKNLT